MLQFTPDNEKILNEVLARYPVKKAALLPVLHLAQRQWGQITPEIMSYVASRLDVHDSEVMNTFTFYTMFRKKAVGKHHIQVCTNLSCYLRGSDELMHLIERKLGIKVGESTADGQFTLDHVECLASCGTAPMMQVNDSYYEDLTKEKVEQLLDKWSAGGAGN